MKLKIKNKFTDRFIELNFNNKDITINGLRDSHCHLVWLGLSEVGLNLEKCNSFQELIDSTLEYTKKNTNTWIIGRGWNDEKWNNQEIEYRQELDKYFPNIPVYLKRIDGHAAILNSKALNEASITSNTIDPLGGKIIKDIHNNPTGLLIDNALEIVNKVIPNYSDDELINYILTAQNKCLEYGLYEVNDMDVYLEWLPVFNYLAQESKLDLKIKSYIRGFDRGFLTKKILPYEINNLEIVGLKFYSDGALGSRGAALIEDYSDNAGNKGIFLIDEATFIDLASQGIERSFEISTHAIGDMANRFTLNVYEKLRKSYPKAKFRIEHSQMVHPIDIIRYKTINVSSAIQPIHCISDEKMAVARIGERVQYAYPWKSLINLGIDVSGGSDFPIESLDPLLGIKALVEPNILWQENEKIDLETALKIYGVIK
jgi:predicted amidohydrolase YtcJ